VKRAGAELQGGFKEEADGIGEPILVVLEGGAVPTLAHARSEAAQEMRRAVEIHIDKNSRDHLAAAVLRGKHIPRPVRTTDALRQMLLLELKPKDIGTRVGESGKPVHEAQRKEHNRVGADRDARAG
jgi:hypothetical protein